MGRRTRGREASEEAPRVLGQSRSSGLLRGNAGARLVGSSPCGSYKLGISRDLIHFTLNKITTFQRGKLLLNGFSQTNPMGQLNSDGCTLGPGLAAKSHTAMGVRERHNPFGAHPSHVPGVWRGTTCHHCIAERKMEIQLTCFSLPCSFFDLCLFSCSFPSGPYSSPQLSKPFTLVHNIKKTQTKPKHPPHHAPGVILKLLMHLYRLGLLILKKEATPICYLPTPPDLG